MISDLQKFILLFGLECKHINNSKVEYRVYDLDSRLQEASQLIESRGFALKAECIGNMAAMRSFQVRSTEGV